MKTKTIYVFAMALVAMIFMGCTAENDTITNSEETNVTSEDDRMLIQIVPVPRVDLVITSYTTNVAPTTTGCGGVLPDVSCMGQRSFMATVTVVNNGPGNLGAGSLSVDWTDVTPAGSSTQRQTLTHGGIPAGGTLTFTRPYWMGPCGCVPPFTYFTHTFSALVDPANLIPESNENNNGSPTYVACDGC